MSTEFHEYLIRSLGESSLNRINKTSSGRSIIFVWITDSCFKSLFSLSARLGDILAVFTSTELHFTLNHIFLPGPKYSVRNWIFFVAPCESPSTVKGKYLLFNFHFPSVISNHALLSAIFSVILALCDIFQPHIVHCSFFIQSFPVFSRKSW